MTFRKHHIIFLIPALFLLIKCIDPINIETEDSQSQIVVEGLVANLPGETFVRLALTNPIANQGFQPDSSIPFTGAEVMVIQDDIESVTFSEFSPGFYRPVDSTFVGAIGSFYQLCLTTADGQEISSGLEVLNPSISIDSIIIQFESVENDNGVEQRSHSFFAAYTPPEGEFFLRTRSRGIARTLVIVDPVPPIDFCSDEIVSCTLPCWSFRNPINGTVTLVDGREVIDNQSVIQTASEDYDYHSLYFYEVSFFSLSKSGFDFWDSFSQQLDLEGSIFDPQITSIQSNLTNASNDPVLGYFGASAITRESVIFNRADIGDGSILPTPTIAVYNCDLVWENARNGINQIFSDELTPDEFK